MIQPIHESLSQIALRALAGTSGPKTILPASARGLLLTHLFRSHLQVADNFRGGRYQDYFIQHHIRHCREWAHSGEAAKYCEEEAEDYISKIKDLLKTSAHQAAMRISYKDHENERQIKAKYTAALSLAFDSAVKSRDQNPAQSLHNMTPSPFLILRSVAEILKDINHEYRSRRGKDLTEDAEYEPLCQADKFHARVLDTFPSHDCDIHNAPYERTNEAVDILGKMGVIIPRFLKDPASTKYIAAECISLRAVTQLLTPYTKAREYCRDSEVTAALKRIGPQKAETSTIVSLDDFRKRRQTRTVAPTPVSV